MTKSSLIFPLTHPDKILYPGFGITKKELFEFFISVQDLILPYIHHRLLSLVRCPQGHNKKCFFQKHFTELKLKSIYCFPIKDSSGISDYLYLKNVTGLLYLAQLNVLEIHPWGSHIRTVEKPDVVIFDLDPSPSVQWKDVVLLAHFIKNELEKINLKSFVKTTGGKGLHIYVPIKPQYNWEQVKLFAKNFATFITSLRPEICIDTVSKSKRAGKIFIDYLRNTRGATAVAPYSPRARDGAPISTPLNWNELTPKIHSDSYTLENFSKRLKKLKNDPWEDFYSTKQTLKLKKIL